MGRPLHDGRQLSLFENAVGYLPAGNPQLLCVITIDEPKMGYHWGGTGAAPVFKRVMKRIINLDDSIKMPRSIENGVNREPILVDKKLNTSDQRFKKEPILLSSVANAIQPVEKPKNTQQNKPKTIVPNVKGMSLKKALNSINKYFNEGFFKISLAPFRTLYS